MKFFKARVLLWPALLLLVLLGGGAVAAFSHPARLNALALGPVQQQLQRT